jgi:nicotinamide-nucleotide amidase
MKAAILTIGDELLIGQVLDTNSSWIAQQLNAVGIKVEEKISIGDDALAIKEVLTRLLAGTDFVFITGGLGPTKDDLTKHTLADYFKDQLVLHDASLENVKRIFKSFGREINEINRQQAFQPSRAQIFVNRNGTASGMGFEKDGKWVFSMPGVPFEMKPMLLEQVLPFLEQRFTFPKIIHKTMCTQGIGESFVAEKIADIEIALPSYIKLAYLPSVGQLKLRLSGYGQASAVEIDHFFNLIAERIADFVFALEDRPLLEVVSDLLRARGETVATAESCTGGYIAHLLTSLSGSSSYYLGGVVAYSNAVKIKNLGVQQRDLEAFGAVSQQVVEQMAHGILLSTGADYGIASSGIAGPDGGTDAKPVGTIWIAVAGKEGIFSKEFKFGDNRERNIVRTALTALSILRRKFLVNHKK